MAKIAASLKGKRRAGALAALAAACLLFTTTAVYAFSLGGFSSDMIAACLVCCFLGAMITFVATRGRTAALLRSALELRDGTELLLRDGRAALLYWNLVRGELSWSASFYDMLGTPTPDGSMPYRDMRDLLHPDDDLYSVVESHIREEAEAISTCFRLRDREDGGWLWFDLRGRIRRRGENGTPILIAVVTDVTSERERQVGSVDKAARLSDSIEAISESFVLWDNRDRLVVCNRKFKAIYKIPNRNLVPGTPYSEIAK
ncbi:MAG TPA: PAS domain-containing protein, partial [Hyphomicrobiales bacterium]|nr:PAS domain-containing protein [Hyphomicrobiales bacterium]